MQKPLHHFSRHLHNWIYKYLIIENMSLKPNLELQTLFSSFIIRKRSLVLCDALKLLSWDCRTKKCQRYILQHSTERNLHNMFRVYPPSGSAPCCRLNPFIALNISKVVVHHPQLPAPDWQIIQYIHHFVFLLCSPADFLLSLLSHITPHSSQRLQVCDYPQCGLTKGSRIIRFHRNQLTTFCKMCILWHLFGFSLRFPLFMVLLLLYKC